MINTPNNYIQYLIQSPLAKYVGTGVLHLMLVHLIAIGWWSKNHLGRHTQTSDADCEHNKMPSIAVHCISAICCASASLLWYSQTVQNGQSVVEAVVLSPARTDQCLLCEVMLGEAYLISCLVISTVVISCVLCQVMLGDAYLISCASCHRCHEIWTSSAVTGKQHSSPSFCLCHRATLNYRYLHLGQGLVSDESSSWSWLWW